MDKAYFTRNEVAALAGVTPWAVSVAVKSGKLNTVDIQKPKQKNSVYIKNDKLLKLYIDKVTYSNKTKSGRRPKNEERS